MNVLIVEDEELAVRKLTKLLTEIDPDLRVVSTAPSIQTAVSYLQCQPALDLIFMDIELADGQSFEIFQQVTVPAPVIFTTSYDEYAIKAFKVNSIDYLLKPIRRLDLMASLQKYSQLEHQLEVPTVPTIDALVQQLRQHIQPVEYRHRFLVRHLSQWLPIETRDIAFFHSEEGVTLFRTETGQKFSLDYTLDELETMLEPAVFFRANRQFLVNVKSVQQIHPYFNNKLKLTLRPTPSEDVLVSRERATDFKRWMGK